MKKLIGLFSLLLFLSINTQKTDAQVVVNVRPARPAVVLSRPAKARRGHTWVAGHWYYNNNSRRYVWRKGHWQRNRSGYNYVAGRWVACNGGHKWVAGRWAPVTVRVNNRPVRRTVVVINGPRVNNRRHSHRHRRCRR